MSEVELLEKKLGFDSIRKSILDKCNTEFARNHCFNEIFSTNKEEINLRLSLTDEMRTILMFEPSFPGQGYYDGISFIKPLENEHSSISLINLVKLEESLNTIRKLLYFFKERNDNKYPELIKLSKQVNSFPEILIRISAILDKHGEIKDNASDELYNIRKELKSKEGSISKKIQSILSSAQSEGIADADATVTIRDGHMLIPISTAKKRKLQGFVYDESSSGKTAFIEPLEIINLNNALQELHFSEKREILKIIMDFSDFLRPYIYELIDSYIYMGKIDFIRAKALVAARFQGGKPILSDNGEHILKKARHPLLEGILKKENKEIVPLDIKLTPQKHILLISGPNAGGKSVCLKTAGLLQYMFQWGILIPASETSELCIFDKIFIDIGDDQSLENDLSTYSSYLLNMKGILKNVTKNSLILIDEFGSGTEPAAGGAIAEEMLDFLEKKHCYGVITTHYTNLKLFATNSSGIINGAMMFDAQKIQPLFNLEIGLPGSSFAFELARKIGLPEPFVHAAEKRAGSDFVNIERQLRKISKSKRALEIKLSKIKKTDRTLDTITDKYEKELTDIKSQRNKIISEAKKEASTILSDANKQIEATIKEIKESQAGKITTKLARHKLNEFTETVKDENLSDIDQSIEKKMQQILDRKQRQKERKTERDAKKGIIPEKKINNHLSKSSTEIPQILKKGVKVKISSNGLVGEILEVNEKKIKVAVGSIISNMDNNKVEIISNSQFKASIKPSHSTFTSSSMLDRKLNFKPNIDIRGKRLNEAIDIVTHFIDDSMILGMGEVSILHGKGNGVLREEIRKYLKITPGVESFKDEHIERGGSGITIVTLEH
ncbi:MAG: Smr/MutS family protein [Bacteroidales bacterium]